jgi:hypothetical protein
MWCEYEKYINICLAYFWLFSSIVWLNIQMSIWKPCILVMEVVCDILCSRLLLLILSS